MKLNAGRHVVGILRGFDPFMNLVLDEAVEQLKDKTNKIGMVVSISFMNFLFKSTACLIIRCLSRNLGPSKVSFTKL